MKKLKIHKKSKKILVLILVLLTVLSGLQLFFQLTFPKTVMNETVQYEAVCSPQVGYQVLIAPNEVYSGTTLNEGEYYSKKLLNYIQTDFELNYQGSKNVPLDIEYQILATVNGYQGDESQKRIYWTKNFPITNKKTIKEKDSGTWSKKERVNFNIGRL